MNISRVTVFAAPAALILLACGPASHSMKLDGMQSKTRDQKACRTKSDCDKLKADAIALLEECEGMKTSWFWSARNCDSEAGMVKEVEKTDYERFLRADLSDKCPTDVTACVQLMALAERYDDAKVQRSACFTGCDVHKNAACCACNDGFGRQFAANDCARGCAQLYGLCSANAVTEQEKGDCARQGNTCKASCGK